MEYDKIKQVWLNQDDGTPQNNKTAGCYWRQRVGCLLGIQGIVVQNIIPCQCFAISDTFYSLCDTDSWQRSELYDKILVKLK